MYTKIHDRIFHFLEQQPKGTLFILSLLLVALLGWVDYITGDYSFILFYLIPVFLAAWFVGTWSGILVCLVSGFASFAANPTRYNFEVTHHFIFRYWDFSLEVIYLLLLSLMFTTLRNKLDHEKFMARTDSLTSALNRRSLYELADYEIEKCRRHNRQMSIAYIDLDNFKMVNDRYGHQTGDELLCEVVGTLRLNLRKSDVVARLGGDEFVVLLPETTASAALFVMQKLNEQLVAVMGKNGWPVTFSIGLLTYETPPDSVEEMISRVDNLMYTVKSRGKDDILHEVHAA